jgi:hypothetical protein
MVQQGPAVSTAGSSNVTQGSATLNLSVDPKNSDTKVWFDWGTDINLSHNTSEQTVAENSGSTLLSMTIGGLACNTTYYFRARAQNAASSAMGDTLSFELVADPSFERGNNAWWVASPNFYIDHAPAFPNPHTGSYYAFLSNADGTWGNSLQGGVISPAITITSNASSAALNFWYSVSTTETSAQAFDFLRVYLVTPGNQLNLLTTISNLDSTGTTYRNRTLPLPSSFLGQTIQIFFAGSTDGSLPTVFRVDDVSLQVTLPSEGAPSVSTQAADQVTATSARLNMTVNPNGAATQVWFNLEAGNPNPNQETEHISIGSDTQSEAVSISAFGLQCGTLYYLKANAKNGYNATAGSVWSFSTPSCGGTFTPPSVTTRPASDITSSSVILNATANPNGKRTLTYFQYGPTTNYGSSTVPVDLGAGTMDAPVVSQLGNLTCNTLYNFNSVASNSDGTNYGSNQTFTTAACDGTSLPSVATLSASRITKTGAFFNATVNPHGQNTTAFFQYGTTTGYEASTGMFIVGADTTVVSVGSNTITLTCNTAYNVRVVAANASGTAYGTNQTFTTDPCIGRPIPPTVTTQPTSSATPTTAYLGLIANPQGNESEAFFQYGMTPEYESSSYHFSIGSDTGDVYASYPIVNLNCDTVYNIRAGATSVYGTSYGDNQSFRTSSCTGVSDVQLLSGVRLGDTLVSPSSQNYWKNYYIDVPPGARQLEVDLTGLSGDLTLYVRHGYKADWTNYDCRPYFSGTSPEVCVLRNPSPGRWWIAVNNYDVGTLSYTVTATVAQRSGNFFALTPCRVVDTRATNSAISGQSGRVLQLGGVCGIPPTASAVVLNVTVTRPTGPGYLSVYSEVGVPPSTATVTFGGGQTRTNNTIIGLLLPDGVAWVFSGTSSSDFVDYIIDVSGYFD